MRRITLTPDDQSSSTQEAEVILQGLNPSQQEAARTTEGPVMIIAGAGSGKTRTLTYRIAFLIAARKAWPSQILALTFTNKAAREMRERILKLAGEEDTRGLWMGTFHSIFARILRIECETLGYTKDFTIYDSDDSQRVIRSLMKLYNIDEKQFSSRAMRNRISGAKNQMISPAEYGRIVNSAADEKAAQIYGPYQEQLRKSNAMDFDDLLVNPIRLFEKSPETLAKYQKRWRYLHIDEYQDTNQAQYMITKMLAAQHKNVCVVGDDAQSIYAFRGADIRNILDFQRDYPDATVVRLEQNYRSTQRILSLADSVIKHNKDQLEKTLWTENSEGSHITFIEAISEKDEAQKIERIIRDLHLRGGYRHGDFAILYRTNAQSRSLEDALRRGNIPYQIIGGTNFYQRWEIKNALAYLRLLTNPSDDESLKRIINYPTRGIGNKTMERIQLFADTQDISLWQALECMDEIGLPSRAYQAVRSFYDMITPYAAKLDTMPADELAKALIQETGMLAELRNENTVESLARWENIQELLNAIAEYTSDSGEHSSLSTFLQEVSLITDADTPHQDSARVKLMTLHASKGLEFPVVCITGLEDGLFPLSGALQDAKELEEERRLLYVGVTRAEEHLFLTSARSRFRYGKHEASIPSRFLSEMNPEVVRTETGRRMGQRSRITSRSFSGSSDNSSHYSQASNWKSTPRKPKRAEPGERRIVYDEGEGGQIVPGVQVEHHLFGRGKVLAVEGEGERTRATVFFKSVGQKKLVLKFAKLRRLG